MREEVKIYGISYMADLRLRVVTDKGTIVGARRLSVERALGRRNFDYLLRNGESKNGFSISMKDYYNMRTPIAV